MIIVFTTVTLYMIGMHLKMNQSLKHRVTPEINCLLILGSCLKDQHVSPTLRARLELGATLLRENPHLHVIVTGGKGTAQLPAEAQVMKRVLIEDYGIEENRILVEDRSTNTFENLFFSQSLFGKHQVAIVTNEFHSVRTSLLARRLGISHIIIGVATPANKRLKWELREHLALLKSFLRFLIIRLIIFTGRKNEVTQWKHVA